MSVVAIIPARGGSKRIPRKNVRPFLGVPLLTRTVEILREAAIFERIIVSTDDDEIAEIARAAGAEVPFRRPDELSNDYAGTTPVIAHAITELERSGATLASVCCVYPAAVLVTAADYRRAKETFDTARVDFVFTATSFGYPIQRALRQTSEGGCEMMWPEYREWRSQDLEPAYHDAGQFYFGRRDAWLEDRPIFSADSRLLVLPRDQVQDIDTLEDWRRAELLFQLRAQPT